MRLEFRSVRAPEPSADRHRLDKWLWYTRFFKSRALATRAVSGGKVKLRGERIKPAHELRAGDRLSISLGQDSIEIDVIAFPDHRRPANIARACYVETPESVKRKATIREQHRLTSLTTQRPDSRPDKQQRRQLEKFRRSQGQQ